eukprot:7609394-Pyramimonas_sp.AAC.1
MAMAVPHKADETNLISSTCTSFVKRVSYESAVLMIGPASAFGATAEKVRQKCFLGGINIDIQKTQ